MRNTVFIKENFIEMLSSINTIEEVEKFFQKNFFTDKILNIIANRRDYLKEACYAINSSQQQIISISGFQGTGKTEFINTLLTAREENILYFYYECSSVTHLDSIILSLFNYMKKNAVKNAEQKRTYKISASQSIDERLINSVKNLNRPLIIVIDGFENIIDFDTEEQKEVIHFLEFLSSVSGIKVIISGRKIEFSVFEGLENVFEIKLGGVKEQEAIKILRDNGIEESESGYRQILEVTRGYPESLLCFANTVKALNISSFDFMQQYYAQNEKNFEEFAYEKLFRLIPDEYFKLICFFTTIRHSIKIDTIENLKFTSNISEKVAFLLSKMILTQNKKELYIKSLIKDVFYEKISPEEKKQVHKYLYEIYSEQISKKLEERIFDISRKLLYSEQYYHYNRLLSLGGRSSDLKEITLSSLKPDYRYLYANISDTLFVGSSDKSEEHSKITQESRSIKTQHQILDNKLLLNDSLTLPEIELSEEEKNLLTTEENKQPDEFQQKEQDFADEEHVVVFNKEKKFASELEQKAEILKNEGEDIYKERQFDKAIKKLEEALILYEILKDKENTVKLFILIANSHNECFRHDEALMYYYKVLNSAGIVLDPKQKNTVLCGIAGIYEYRNDFQSALKYYQEALNEAEKYNNIKWKTNTCFKIALAYDDIGDSDNAVKFYLKNTEISADIKINTNIAPSFSNMAAIYEEQGDFNKAKYYYQQSLKFDRLAGNNDGQYETLSRAGNLYFETEDYRKADSYFHEALKIARKMDDPYKISMSFLDIGDIYMQEKNYEKAIKAFIIAGKTIEKTISTDSKEKIDRRFKQVINEIGEYHFKRIVEKLKKKHA